MQTSNKSLWRFCWLALPLSLFCALGLLVVGITGFFRLSGDAQALRDSVMRACDTSPAAWQKKIQLRFGAFSFQALRTGLALFDLPPEARAALRSVRGAEVGLYRRCDYSEAVTPGAVLVRADQAMTARGWERVVGVVHDQQLVAVYVRTSGPGAKLPACVVVMDEHQLVVVSARSDLTPLFELALKHPEWRSAHWTAAQL